MKPFCVLLISIAWGWVWSFPAQAQSNGIFADFSTSAGIFTVELNYGAAPRTTAHFMRIAEGTQTWMDPLNGAVWTAPWYSGSGFYRVQFEVPTPGTTNVLALQGGLRAVAGNWSGGPGYAILDEATNGLSHSNGVISMVTQGPHTGAAEFMILLTNGAKYWDGCQTVFGRVSAGMPVVQAIANGGHAAGALLAATTISNVTIRRVGGAAEAFTTDRADLPTVQPDGCRVDMLSGGTSQYVYVKGPQSETIMAHTADLVDPRWVLYSLGFNGSTQAVAAAATFSTTVAGWFKHFFHGTRVSYPVFSAIPLEQMAGITFAAQWGDGTVYQYWLDLVAKTGMWQNITTTGEVVKINDCIFRTRGANCSQLNFMDKDGNIFDYTLGFDAPGAKLGRYYLWLEMTQGAEWGDCQYAAWIPGAKTQKVRPDSEATRSWPASRSGPAVPRGISKLAPGPVD